MAVKKQLSLALPNEPGALAKACKVLAKAGVNIQAIGVSDSADVGVVRIMTNNPNDAKRALADASIMATPQDVLVLEAPDKPGALSGIAGKLGRAGININYVYGSACGCGCGDPCEKSTLVMSVSDPKAADKILAD